MIRRAQARDYVKRTVAPLGDAPKGRPGRPSKSLKVDQAGRLIAAAFADTTVMRPYVVVALMTGARTEKLRALIWAHVDLDGDPPTLSLWRSARASRDTKTKSSRRTLELPAPGVEVLRAHRVAQLLHGSGGAVGPVSIGVQHQRPRRNSMQTPGPPESCGTGFVSLLSSTGLAIEDMSHLVGHANMPLSAT